MSAESLEVAIARAGGPVELLRNASARPYTFPVRPEFSNWRSEQQAWRETCALLDRSHHMADLFVRGPESRTKVTLIWDPEEMAHATGSQFGQDRGAKYIDFPKARYALFQYDEVLAEGRRVGISMDCGYVYRQGQA
jgi:vanillate/3-O-methylgallate O-demethylase